MAAVIAVFSFLTELLRGIVLLIPDLLKLIKIISEYFQAKNKREADAVSEALNQKLKAAQEQERKESANHIAFLKLIEASWLTRYEQILDYLNSKQEAEVITLCLESDIPEINAILFNSELNNESKARYIVQYMRRIERR